MSVKVKRKLMNGSGLVNLGVSEICVQCLTMLARRIRYPGPNIHNKFISDFRNTDLCSQALEPSRLLNSSVMYL